MTLICASLDARYEDRLGKFWAGSAAIPVTKLSTVACEGSAKGLNAFTARKVPLTFVCWETRAQQDSRTGRDARDDGLPAAEPFKVAAYLKAPPPIVRVCFDQGGRSSGVAGGEHQYVPLANCCCRLVEGSLVCDIQREDSRGDAIWELGLGLVQWFSRTAEKNDLGSPSSRKGSCCRSSNTATLQLSSISFKPGRITAPRVRGGAKLTAPVITTVFPAALSSGR